MHENMAPLIYVSSNIKLYYYIYFIFQTSISPCALLDYYVPGLRHNNAPRYALENVRWTLRKNRSGALWSKVLDSYRSCYRNANVLFVCPRKIHIHTKRILNWSFGNYQEEVSNFTTEKKKSEKLKRKQSRKPEWNRNRIFNLERSESKRNLYQKKSRLERFCVILCYRFYILHSTYRNLMRID